MKILCHVGPWCVDQYRAIAKSIDEYSTITLISNFTDIDESNLNTLFYQSMASNEDPSAAHFDYQEFDDMRLRCRFLRSLTEKKAKLYYTSMKHSVEKVFDKINPDVIITETVDQYLIDLIRIEANKRNIPIFGLVVSFVNNYYRLTTRGGNEFFREVNDHEVDKVHQKLTGKNYKPDFLAKSSWPIKDLSKILLRISSNWVKIPFFHIYKHIKLEKHNYHYNASGISALDSLQFFPAVTLGESNWEKQLLKESKKTIYHPLQMYPEATIEYWCDCLSDIKYEEKLLSIIEKYSDKFHFVIKEHPNVIGLRNKDLYKKISEFSNTTFVPTNIDSNKVISKVDSVLVWTGSSGFEAALRGKPVLTVCEPYYVTGRFFKKLNEDTSGEEILRFLRHCDEDISEHEAKDMVRHLLTVIMPGKYINNKSWKKCNLENVVQSREIGQQIRKLIG